MVSRSVDPESREHVPLTVVEQYCLWDGKVGGNGVHMTSQKALQMGATQADITGISLLLGGQLLATSPSLQYHQPLKQLLNYNTEFIMWQKFYPKATQTAQFH